MSRDRAINNVINSDVTKPFRPRRIEVINGIERRRSWPDEVKIAIMAEALEPGAIISQVARRHDMSPSQLFGWLRKLRSEAAVTSGKRPPEADAPLFVPAVLENAREPSAPRQQAEVPGSIEITLSWVKVSIRGAVDERTLAMVLKALRVRP